MQKPQKPKKREDDLGSRRYDWKDWEKRHNYMTGYSFNRMYDVYQQNEQLRVRNNNNIQSMEQDIDKMRKTSRKQIEALKEDYKVMMAYGYVYKLHSIGQDPDNDELPLIRKRVKPPPAQQKPKDPDFQLLHNDILEYYDDRPSSFRLPSVAPKWRPMSFAGNPKTDGEVREQVEQWIDDPFPTPTTEELLLYKQKNDQNRNTDKKNDSTENGLRLPAIGTLTLKLSNWKTFGIQNVGKVNQGKIRRNAMSEPPSRWRGRETQNKLPQLNRPKSYVPEAEFSCITPANNRRFYDKEAKKALEKLTPTNRRHHETQKILRNISNPLGSLIDSKKTTSAILKDYRKGRQHEVKKGPIKGLVNSVKTDKPKPQLHQNWVVGNKQDI